MSEFKLRKRPIWQRFWLSYSNWRAAGLSRFVAANAAWKVSKK